MQLACRFIHHPTKHLGVPEINGSEYGHGRSGKQYVMEMGHDEIRVMDKNIDRRGCHENPGEPPDDEHGNKGRRKQHRGGKLHLATPDRSHPVKYLDRTGQGNHHRRRHECHSQHRVHAGHEHMMSPDDET